MAALSDPSIHGIVSTIGGEDSIRILQHLDLDVIRSNPKVFLGYSDTTVTHFACLKAGLVSFYGPSIMAGFGENGGLFPYMAESVRRTLFSAEPIGAIEPNRDGWTVEHLDWSVTENQERKRALNPSEPWRFLQGEGIAEGRLVGGCLEVVEFLRGTSVWPDDEVWEGAILFLETSEDAPSEAVLRYTLRSYAAMGILQRLSGILFGRPGGPVPVEDFGKYDKALLQVVATEEGLTGLPIVTRMDFGHTDPMFVLPYGVKARIDCGKRSFAILESAVTERDSQPEKKV
jgi:muramoyltetrapeptide carboxypeptidase LdcA involved in peptidoglycan recycling